ncbi:GH-E family nuclease [Chryseobacterium sp.]|uniref:GH-E family nuclease n=1 Tax=Chryseobacterium sp. TaxID=1871047 RepID=UPI00321A9941
MKDIYILRVGPIPNLEPPQYFPKGHPHEGRRKPRANIGHKTGNEWKYRLAEHKRKGHTREQIVEIENDAKLYEIQDRTKNRSHVTEAKNYEVGKID